MTRRRLTIGVGLLLLLLSGLLTWKWFIPTEPERAYERLRLGMTLEEVESAIGKKSGDFRDIPSSDASSFVMNTFDLEPVRVAGIPYYGPMLTGPWRDNRNNRNRQLWTWEHLQICVFLDDEGKAEGIYLLKLNYYFKPTFFERMRGLLGI